MNASQTFVEDFLSRPVDEFLSRPKKDFRGDLVRIGFSLSAKPEGVAAQGGISTLSRMLEWIHGGSLIIDDIQDNSQERRGNLTMHLMHGIPCAINAANWMYFEALKLVHELPVGDQTKLKILNLTHLTMADAHLGQALDLSAHMAKIPRADIFDVGMRSHKLKSGALVGLALQVGALLGDPEADTTLLGEIGNDLGASLQRFDDLGNLKLGTGDPKALEDLRLGRPSWIWMYAARYASEEDFIGLRHAVDLLPDESTLRAFLLKTTMKELALREAQRLHQELDERIEASFKSQELRNILERIKNAYT